jgi:hypothetical protein
VVQSKVLEVVNFVLTKLIQTFDIVGKPLTIGFSRGDFIDFRPKMREILNLE